MIHNNLASSLKNVMNFIGLTLGQNFERSRSFKKTAYTKLLVVRRYTKLLVVRRYTKLLVVNTKLLCLFFFVDFFAAVHF